MEAWHVSSICSLADAAFVAGDVTALAQLTAARQALVTQPESTLPSVCSVLSSECSAASRFFVLGLLLDLLSPALASHAGTVLPVVCNAALTCCCHRPDASSQLAHAARGKAGQCLARAMRCFPLAADAVVAAILTAATTPHGDSSLCPSILAALHELSFQLEASASTASVLKSAVLPALPMLVPGLIAHVQMLAHSLSAGRAAPPVAMQALEALNSIAAWAPLATYVSQPLLEAMFTIVASGAASPGVVQCCEVYAALATRNLLPPGQGHLAAVIMQHATSLMLTLLNSSTGVALDVAMALCGMLRACVEHMAPRAMQLEPSFDAAAFLTALATWAVREQRPEVCIVLAATWGAVNAIIIDSEPERDAPQRAAARALMPQLSLSLADACLHRVAALANGGPHAEPALAATSSLDAPSALFAACIRLDSTAIVCGMPAMHVVPRESMWCEQGAESGERQSMRDLAMQSDARDRTAPVINEPSELDDADTSVAASSAAAAERASYDAATAMLRACCALPEASFAVSTQLARVAAAVDTTSVAHGSVMCAVALTAAMLTWRHTAMDVQAVATVHAAAQAVLQACVQERLHARNDACTRLACVCLLFEACHLTMLEAAQVQATMRTQQRGTHAGSGEQLQARTRETDAQLTFLLVTSLTLLESSPTPPVDMLACSAAHLLVQLTTRPCLRVVLRASSQVCAHVRAWVQSHAHTLSPHVHSACMRAMLSIHVDAAAEPAAVMLQHEFPIADAAAASHMISLTQRALQTCVDALAAAARDAAQALPDARAVARARSSSRVCARATGIFTFLATHAPECVCATATEGARTHVSALLQVAQGCCVAACAGEASVAAGVWADACHALYTVTHALSHETLRSRPDLHGLAGSASSSAAQLVAHACEHVNPRTATSAIAGLLYLLRAAREHVSSAAALDGHVHACVAALSNATIMLHEETAHVTVLLAENIVMALHTALRSLTPDCGRIVNALAAVCVAQQLPAHTRSRALQGMLHMMLADCFAEQEGAIEAVLLSVAAGSGTAVSEDVAYVLWAAAKHLPRLRSSIFTFVYGAAARDDVSFDAFVVACMARCGGS